MLISQLGSVVAGVHGPVEAKERDQDPTKITVSGTVRKIEIQRNLLYKILRHKMIFERRAF